MPKRRDSEVSDESSDTSIESDDVSKSKAKKAKNGNAKKANKPLRLQLGKTKYVTISAFKGSRYVDIREWYTDKESGEEKPGKKGISLDGNQWKKLMENVDEIDTAFSEK